MTYDINNKTTSLEELTSDMEFSLHIFFRLTRRHAANDLILLHCTNMKQTLLLSLFIIYINYKLDKELQNTSGMDHIYMDIGLNKTHYHKTKMLQARIHFQHFCTPQRSSRNWNVMEKLCDFI